VLQLAGLKACWARQGHAAALCRGGSGGCKLLLILWRQPTICCRIEVPCQAGRDARAPPPLNPHVPWCRCCIALFRLPHQVLAASGTMYDTLVDVLSIPCMR
jgi:hypothetical protein